MPRQQQHWERWGERVGLGSQESSVVGYRREVVLGFLVGFSHLATGAQGWVFIRWAAEAREAKDFDLEKEGNKKESVLENEQSQRRVGGSYRGRQGVE